MSFWENPFLRLVRKPSKHEPTVREIRHHFSPALGREVAIDVYLPPDYASNRSKKYPICLFNDGQDLPRMDFRNILRWLYQRKKIPPIIAVGVHCGPERAREYGTSTQPNYKGQGDRAAAHRDFLIKELMPFLFEKFRLSGLVEETAIAGFSLGGLSAFDIGWAEGRLFGSIGVFSGAFWWRSTPVSDADPDGDRIMHDIVGRTKKKNDGQRFWFECGERDEEDDRNQNGIIDSIDDTLDLMKILYEKGYRDEDVRYVEVPDGRHDPETWGLAMPDFLIWAFGPERFNLM